MAAIFSGYIFKYIFSNENCGILIQISLKFVTKDPIANKSSLIRVMNR